MSMNADHVIGVDPGGTTGLAYWVAPTNPDAGRSPFEGEPVERKNKDQMLEDIGGWCQRLGSGLVVVCESYTITARTAKLSQQLDPLKIIGVLEFFEHMYGTRLVLQKPADAKRFSTDARLKAADMWKPTTGGHANDAQRHLFMYLVKHGKINIGEVDARRT